MPAAPSGIKKVYVIAGEASGDMHGARLIESLKKLSASEPVIYGVGGDKIKATGALDFFDLAHFHVTGFTQAVKKIPQYKKAAVAILASIEKRKPDVVVLIDNPGFNLYLAEKIKKMAIPVIYYISPQIWAWKKNRIFKIKRTVEKMLVVFEFEKALYEKHGVPVAFVGHPLKDNLQNDAETAPERWIALLPGSRKNEVSTLLPIMLKAAEKIGKRFTNIRFKLIKSPTLPARYYEPFLNNAKTRVDLVEENAPEVIQKSLLAIVCSGTATLECALLGTPMIITNRASFLTYALAKIVLRIPYLGLPNIILNKMAMPELLQYDATPQKFTDHTIAILSDTPFRRQMKKDLSEISAKLGPGGAADNAAKEILSFLN